MLFTLVSLAGLVLLLAYAAIIQRCLAAWSAIPEWKPPPGLQPQAFVTVLVPARNEAARITPLLDSLARQSYPRKRFEVIVIDDHSTDGTAEAVRQHPLPNLRLLHLAEHIGPEEKVQAYKKRALALGVSYSREGLILTTDADCEAPPHWLARHAAFHEATGAQLVAAPVLFHREQSLLQRFQSLDLIGMMGVTGAGVSRRFLYMANGANLAFTKSIFQKVGGYTGNEKQASGDDVFLIQKVAAAVPGRVAFLKNQEATVYSLPAPGLKAFVQQRLRWGTKNNSYRDWRITGVLGLVFVLCWFILGLLMATPLFGFFGLGLALVLLAGKGLADYLFLSAIATFFRRPRLVEGRRFWLYEGMHVLYIALIGLAALVVKRYTWKGRRVR